MYSHKIDLTNEIKRYISLRDQCNRMIKNLGQSKKIAPKDSFAHEFRDICDRQIDLLTRALSVSH